MPGSKRFIEAAQKLIEDSDRGAKVRQKRWRAMQKMQQLKVDDLKKGEEDAVDTDAEKKRRAAMKITSAELVCACEMKCYFAVVLANLSRVVWVAYEEYELLHACYTELFQQSERPSMTKKVAAYWSTFAVNPKPAPPHTHAERLLRKCEYERSAHVSERESLPHEIVSPIQLPLLDQLLDPFSCVKCRCLRCGYLDAVMDYRVALFSLLTEYSKVYEDYAALFWSSEVKINQSGDEVTLAATEMDVKMFKMTMSELHTAMSFNQQDNQMKCLGFVRDLVYR